MAAKVPQRGDLLRISLVVFLELQKSISESSVLMLIGLKLLIVLIRFVTIGQLSDIFQYPLHVYSPKCFGK